MDYIIPVWGRLIIWKQLNINKIPNEYRKKVLAWIKENPNG